MYFLLASTSLKCSNEAIVTVLVECTNQTVRSSEKFIHSKIVPFSYMCVFFDLIPLFCNFISFRKLLLTSLYLMRAQEIKNSIISIAKFNEHWWSIHNIIKFSIRTACVYNFTRIAACVVKFIYPLANLIWMKCYF